MDVWAGRYWRMSQDFSGDLRLSQYTYPDDPRRVSYNRTEITGTMGFRNQLFLAAIYSPNTKAVASSPGYEEGDAWALELSGRHPINERFAISAGFGHYGLDDVYHDSYNYWNVTITANLAPFELQLAYLGRGRRRRGALRRGCRGRPRRGHGPMAVLEPVGREPGDPLQVLMSNWSPKVAPVPLKRVENRIRGPFRPLSRTPASASCWNASPGPRTRPRSAPCMATTTSASRACWRACRCAGKTSRK